MKRLFLCFIVEIAVFVRVTLLQSGSPNVSCHLILSRLTFANRSSLRMPKGLRSSLLAKLR